MHLKPIFCAVAAAALLAGCQSAPKKTANTAPGSVVGGVIGSKVGQPAPDEPAPGDVGSLLGAYMGKPIAASLSSSDRSSAADAARRAYAAPVGEVVVWSNPQSGNTGTVTSTRGGYNSAGEYCREYQQTVTVGDVKEMAFGTACKQGDGTWKLVD